jgi:hypothetical protein
MITGGGGRLEPGASSPWQHLPRWWWGFGPLLLQQHAPFCRHGKARPNFRARVALLPATTRMSYKTRASRSTATPPAQGVDQDSNSKPTPTTPRRSTPTLEGTPSSLTLIRSNSNQHSAGQDDACLPDSQRTPRGFRAHHDDLCRRTCEWGRSWRRCPWKLGSHLTRSPKPARRTMHAWTDTQHP